MPCKLPERPAVEGGGKCIILILRKMKKDKLLKEFEHLKIENPRNVVGGQQSWNWTYQDYWVKTDGPSGQPNDWHLDKHTLKFQDPDFSSMPSDTTATDTTHISRP